MSNARARLEAGTRGYFNPFGFKLVSLEIKYSSLPAIQAEALKRKITYKITGYNEDTNTFSMDIPKTSKRRWRKFHRWLSTKGHIRGASYN